jgi:hypothetical protein
MVGSLEKNIERQKREAGNILVMCWWNIPQYNDGCAAGQYPVAIPPFWHILGVWIET